MKKIAIVVQRCHKSVVGGSESLAWQYAMLLTDSYEVDLLTTTATDIAEWANVLPKGTERLDGINIQRFHVDIGRTPSWGQLYTSLKEEYEIQRERRNRVQYSWRIPLQEDFIRRQGPYSKGLLEFLRRTWTKYQTIIFVTYLYPTTYFGIMEVPKNQCLLVPTLHDEPLAYLSAYKHMARRARACLWLSEAERALGNGIWGTLPGSIVQMSVDTRLRDPADLSVPYLLYCGRIEANKNCNELFEYFIKFKRDFPSPLRLILTGKKEMQVPDHLDIEFLGFVPTEKKFSLMSGASILLVPSAFESLSIVTLEAMGQKTPVLVDARSEVLCSHVKQSGAGRIYEGYQSFANELTEMLKDQKTLSEMGARGREYVVSRYQRELIKESLIAAIDQFEP